MGLTGTFDYQLQCLPRENARAIWLGHRFSSENGRKPYLTVHELSVNNAFAGMQICKRRRCVCTKKNLQGILAAELSAQQQNQLSFRNFHVPHGDRKLAWNVVREKSNGQ